MHGKHDPADVAHHDRQGTSGLSRIPALEFNTYLLSFMSSRAIIAIVPDLGDERDPPSPTARAPRAMLCNQFLGAHKDMPRPASSWSANCGGRHHLRRSY